MLRRLKILLKRCQQHNKNIGLSHGGKFHEWCQYFRTVPCRSGGRGQLNGCSIWHPAVGEPQGARPGLVRQTMTTRCCPWKSIINREASLHLFLLGVMRHCLTPSFFFQEVWLRWRSDGHPCGISDATEASGTVLVNQSRWTGAMTGLWGLHHLLGLSGWVYGGVAVSLQALSVFPPSVRHVKLE